MTSLPEPAPAHELRISNADRERVAEILQTAISDGRLTLHELDERLAAVYAARTHSELVPLTSDLVPATQAQYSPQRYLDPVELPAHRRAVAVMSGFQRKGRWSVGRLFSCLAFLGGGVVDLREARFVEGGARIRAFAILGGVQVITAPDANVHVRGVGILGGFDDAATGPGAPGAPTIVVTGLAFWGGVNVKRRPYENNTLSDTPQRPELDGRDPNQS